jgi:hypothetical protein
MKRRLLASMLCLMLIPLAIPVAAGQAAAPRPKLAAAVTRPVPSAATPQTQQPTSVRPMSTTQRRSYEREVRPRRHSRHISKGEIIFMAGIAGTSMGIGALAGGGTGLAIGAIVGGWGAYAGHRIWHWVK